MLSIRLEPDLEQRLETLAQRSGRPKSGIAREAIVRYLDTHTAPPQSPLERVGEVREALAEYAAVTGESPAVLLRGALAQLQGQYGAAVRQARLAAGRGLWAAREDLPDFAALRREFDRTPES